MKYNVKLSNDGNETLRTLLGLTDGYINLNTGIIQVNDKNDVRNIAKKFGIKNVNHQPYEEIVADSTQLDDPISSLKKRNQTIGYDLEVGSVVRVKTKNEIKHVVIIAVDGNKYTVAQLLLSDNKKMPKETVMIHLKKGEDIVYRNRTYRYVVTLINEITYGLEWKDFMKGAGGMIVGKVTNLELIQPIIDNTKANGEETAQEEPAANLGDAGAEATETGEQKNIDSLKAIEETETFEEPATNPSDAEAESPETGEQKSLDFLKVIEEAETLEELFSKLELDGDILMQAAEECIKTGRSNIKRLIPILKSKDKIAYGRLNQSAIKNKMNEEFKAWFESHNVDMKECSVSYFLRTIVKGLKKS